MEVLKPPVLLQLLRCASSPRGNQRFNRLTNVFQQEGRENHDHAMAIYFMHYNFVRIHGSLRFTPAVPHGRDDEALGTERHDEGIGGPGSQADGWLTLS